MSYSYFSHNGTIQPIDQAVIPLDNVAYAYGFGVYENIRQSHGLIYFLDQHLRRLLNSADIIALPHNFSADFIAQSIDELVAKNEVETCNLKVLLIGGPTADDASFNILCLNPLFPDRKLYKQGASAITYPHEREFPHAKSLNMLPSYLAYRQARQAGAYDALLINRAGNITEGTRTNFFGLQDRTLYSPPTAEILPGVTRDHVLQVAAEHNFTVIHQAIALDNLASYDAAFLTSTSSKIMPLQAIDDYQFGAPSPALQELMRAFEDFLADYRTSII